MTSSRKTSVFNLPFFLRAHATRRCAASIRSEAENCVGRIHFARKRLESRVPAGRKPCGKNWRDNVNYIRSFGYDEQ